MYGINMEYIIMGLGGMIVILFILVIVLFAKLSGLKKKYQAFMTGQNGASLENQIEENYNLMKKLDLKQQEQELEMLDMSDHVNECTSKISLVKYNAFNDMGGKLSFALAVLNDKRDGYILNCMHSNNGSYIYAKEVNHGACDLELSKEEAESLQRAIGQ
jgi:cell division protein FtsL